MSHKVCHSWVFDVQCPITHLPPVSASLHQSPGSLLLTVIHYFTLLFSLTTCLTQIGGYSVSLVDILVSLTLSFLDIVCFEGWEGKFIHRQHWSTYFHVSHFDSNDQQLFHWLERYFPRFFWTMRVVPTTSTLVNFKMWHFVLLDLLCSFNYTLIIFYIFNFSRKNSPVDYLVSLFWETVFPWGVFLYSWSHNNMNRAIKSQFPPVGCASNRHLFDTG